MFGVHPDLLVLIVTLGAGAVAFVLVLAWMGEARAASRAFWGRAGLAGLLGLGLGMGGYATLIEPTRLIVNTREIVSPHWSGPALTLAVMADTHVGGAHVDSGRVNRIVERINALNPDLVVLLGDYVDGSAPAADRTPAQRLEVALGVAAFARLRAPLGVISVIGNHDVWYGREDIETALIDAGVTTLWNRLVIVERGEGRFVVAGLADADTGAPSVPEALDGAPDDAPVVLLTHSPDPFSDLDRPAALVLAGHTHCGQVGLPVLGRPLVPSRHGQRYACGEIWEHNVPMIVTSGVGTSILPVRLFNPPAIEMITLRGEDPN